MIAQVLWLLGGPIPQAMKDGMRADAAALNFGCNATATRELLGGEAFWSRYRRRLTAITDAEIGRWAAYADDPKNQVSLLFVPPSR